MTLKETAKKIIPKFLLRMYHFMLALLGAVIFGFPGLLRSRASDGQGKNKSIKIIGVTGTSGKSTTTDFITRILEGAGNKVGSISSIRFKIGEKEWENKYKMTMPGRFVIQNFLRQAVNAKCNFVVLEVTSEGIRQFRHKFINFDTAVFTNLSPEHIESHGSFENYRNEKLKLFRATKNIHVINADDKNAKYFLDIVANKKIVFGIKDKKDYDFDLNLLGDFNVMNALAAISVAKAYGINFEICKKVLENAKGIAGRMEVVNKNPLVVVDYAHTPEQLESVYKALSQNPKSEIRNPKLICVLGSCGGGRDKWKRPVLGEIAQKYCTKIFITNEDPYDENPLEIMKEIEGGFSQIRNPKSEIRNYELVLDRKKAIKKAIDSASENSAVIITGKGSEPWMCVANGKKVPWDDRQIARDALHKR